MIEAEQVIPFGEKRGCRYLPVR